MCTVTKKDIHENQNTKINNINKKKMSKEDLDLIEFVLIVYIALFVTIIGFRQINQIKDE